MISARPAGIPLADPAPQQIRVAALQQPPRALLWCTIWRSNGLPPASRSVASETTASSVDSEDRVQEIILRAAFVDVGADQRRAPARGGRQRQHIVGPDHAVAHAMRARLVRTAVLRARSPQLPTARWRNRAIARRPGYPSALRRAISARSVRCATIRARRSSLSSAMWSASRPRLPSITSS